MEQNFIESAAPRGAAAEQVAGYVKWYDAEKGFGFIVPDGGGPDVFLGKAVVEMAGFGVPGEGCRVEATAQVRPRGRSATALLRVGPADPAVLETLRAARRTRPAPSGPRPADVTGPRRGTVKLFSSARGFGFVTIGDGTPDIFFHVTTPGSNLRAVRVGDEVDVVWGSGPNGLTAVEVVLAEEPAEMRRSA